jgi:hypothetical protein
MYIRGFFHCCTFDPREGVFELLCQDVYFDMGLWPMLAPYGVETALKF